MSSPPVLTRPAPVIERYQAPGRSSVVTLRFSQVAAGWEQWVLLRSDAHHDNTHCLQKLEKRHLDLAKARNALVFDMGDLHCCMQGRWDPRRSMAQCPPELRVDNYLDALQEYTAAFYLPYAKQFALLAPGNHETSVLSRNQVDLTESLAKRLRDAGSLVQVGTYRGWVRFCFNCNGTLRRSFDLHYTHGYGGGGPVTKDIIQSARQLEYLANADVVVFGHTHYQWHVPVPRERLSGSGRPESIITDVVKPGTYKDEFGGSGWAIEKGMGPKPLGAYWMRIFFYNNQIHREFIRAGDPF